jgi:two-component system, OmpR family, alkaline phosphatase synthesis response regulator PhoP
MDYHLLLIRDEIPSKCHVTEALKEQGYSVAAASRSRFATDPGIADSFDLIVIDHSEPQINASDICIELRQRSIVVPIVVLAETCDHAQHRVEVFRAGADDYLVKPVDLGELQIRIESLLIRSDRNKTKEIAIYEFEGRLVDFTQSHLVRNGLRIELSEREARLLRYFVQHRGETLSRGALLRHVWGYPQAPLTRTVDVHIVRLRHKIEDNPKEPQFILTVPGVGYRFTG